MKYPRGQSLSTSKEAPKATACQALPMCAYIKPYNPHTQRASKEKAGIPHASNNQQCTPYATIIMEADNVEKQQLPLSLPVMEPGRCHTPLPGFGLYLPFPPLHVPATVQARPARLYVRISIARLDHRDIDQMASPNLVLIYLTATVRMSGVTVLSTCKIVLERGWGQNSLSLASTSPNFNL